MTLPGQHRANPEIMFVFFFSFYDFANESHLFVQIRTTSSHAYRIFFKSFVAELDHWHRPSSAFAYFADLSDKVLTRISDRDFWRQPAPGLGTYVP